ncbi:hypothetical protein S40285_09170 [Stachybotrys chlorohalonatus IBT 40285]|uniref:Uncharacterized protein n=1 Tax=Stachybotrys chlorohalonatus (strain IBT 40285) TaxID=1283841 RepID=A0A084QZA8_STAC4|nr:hypothetical protein S40285_09170 [Stachybotrys chlorohalonata IBT 40285]
MRDGDRHGL